MSDQDSSNEGGARSEHTYLNIGWKHPGVAGFVSVDVEFDDRLSGELAEGFPFEGRTVDGIRCEDLIHRLNRPDGANLLRSCRRVMSTDSVLRLATMDLKSLVESYHDMVSQPDIHALGRPCELLNSLFQATNTQWIYDEDELVRMARIAGLDLIGRQRSGESMEPAFQDLNDYTHCDMVLEFGLPERGVPEDVKVSVLIAASRPTFLKEALSSALEQSWKNIEVIVCDDSQGAEVEAICQELCAKDARLRYERNETKLGAQRTWHRLFELSSGEYIKFLSDDDVLHPECVERLSRCLQAYPWVTLATGYRQVVDSAGEPMLRRGDNSHLVFEDSIVEGISAINLLLETRTNFIGGPSCGMFRRNDGEDASSLMQFNGTDGGVLPCVALWIKLLSQGDLVYLVQAMSSHRQHPEQAHRQVVFEDALATSWSELEETARPMGFLVDGMELMLKARPLAIRPWWSNVVVRIYRSASEKVEEKGLSEASEDLLTLNAMLPDEPWPPVVLAESLLAAGESDKALKVMSPTLSHHRDYFPGYALAGSALASLGKNEDAKAVFAEGCVWALPMFSTRNSPMGLGEPFELRQPRHLWIQTGRFRFAISFRLMVTSVPEGISLPIRVPILVNGKVLSECAFYGSGDSAEVMVETPADTHNSVLRLGPIEDLMRDSEGAVRLRLQDLRVVLIGKGT